MMDIIVEDNMVESLFHKPGGHYNIFRVKEHSAMSLLRNVFPEAKANELNFVLFSTSGVHSTYNTIEESEAHFRGENPDGYGEITFLVIHPRICCLQYGNVTPMNQEDFVFLKQLRQSSWDAVMTIGKGR